jgi:hypothetical protein
MSSHITTSTRHRLPATRGISTLGPQPLIWHLRLVSSEQWGNSHSRRFAYAAVAAKISLRFAFVKPAMHNENTTVNPAMIPNLARMLEISYNITTGAISITAAKIVEISEAALAIFLELYSTYSD